MFHVLGDSTLKSRDGESCVTLEICKLYSLSQTWIRRRCGRHSCCFWKNKISKLVFKTYYFYVGSELSMNLSHPKLINLNAGDLLLSHR